MNPTDRKYTDDHEWVLAQDGAAVIGITDFAQQELGDIVFVELPETGKAVKKGDSIGTIESVKAVSDIYAPISGTVTEVNSKLEEAPDTVNTDPFGDGWYCKMQVDDAGELDGLMDAAAYETKIEG